jgi:hypothetical protein
LILFFKNRGKLICVSYSYRYKDVNKDYERHESRIVSSEEAQNILIESENPKLICESNKEAKNSLDEQELNASDSLSSIEPCFDATDEKNKQLTQQRQVILAGVVGAVLLVSSIELYIIKMPVAAVVGIAGLACVGFTLYNTLKPNTKLKKVENVEQSAHPPMSLSLCI